MPHTETVETARVYYNSDDADNFYFNIWGGEDIHIGLYADQDSIAEASIKTVEKMADCLKGIGENSKVLDLGAGYGGAARYLTKRFGATVDCLNLSEVQNHRNRDMNKEQGTADKINVIDGSFENIPAEDNSYDVVWSQDAILHSGQRARVLEETARVLKPGGTFIFTDIMQSDDCPEGVLGAILARIHLETLGSPAFYRQTSEVLGLKEKSYLDLTENLIVHYGRVHDEIVNREEELLKYCAKDYLSNMKEGLRHWVNGGNKGYLNWGIFQFKS